jgi:hypothetical protein
MPVGVDASGGAAIASPAEQSQKILRTALSPCYSWHAFQQDLGLGENEVFDINSPLTIPRLRRRVKRILDAFRADDRYKLVPGTLKVEETTEDSGDVVISFSYIDIEADTEQQFVDTLLGVSEV